MKHGLTFYLLMATSLLQLVQWATAAELKKDVVNSYGHPMALWHKHPEAGKQTGHSILLLHGRTWSSLPDFDLQVEGESLSVMDSLVELGVDVWALDARGYGQTPRDKTGWNTPNKAAADVVNALSYITNKAQQKPILFGWSYGSVTAQLAVQQQPEAAKALILYGYPLDLVLGSVETKLPITPPRNRNTAKNAASDFIVPNSISQRAIDTYVADSLKADPYRADWNQLEEWKQLDATKVNLPVLLLQAEHDPLVNQTTDSQVFMALPNANKQWVILAGGDHAALLEHSHGQFIRAIANFSAWLK